MLSYTYISRMPVFLTKHDIILKDFDNCTTTYLYVIEEILIDVLTNLLVYNYITSI